MKKVWLGFALLLIPLTVMAANDPLRRVAREFGRKMQTMKSPRVGVMSFPYHDGKISSGSSIISERLMTHLAATKNVRIVERSLLQKVLEEQHLAETGVVNPAEAKKIGKILDVDVIVTGTLIDTRGNLTELNARALKADTGEVIAASRAMVDRTWPDRPRQMEYVRRNDLPPETEEKTENPNEAIMIGIPGKGGRGGFR